MSLIELQHSPILFFDFLLVPNHIIKFRFFSSSHMDELNFSKHGKTDVKSNFFFSFFDRPKWHDALFINFRGNVKCFRAPPLTATKPDLKHRISLSPIADLNQSFN